MSHLIKIYTVWLFSLLAPKALMLEAAAKLCIQRKQALQMKHILLLLTTGQRNKSVIYVCLQLSCINTSAILLLTLLTTRYKFIFL